MSVKIEQRDLEPHSVSGKLRRVVALAGADRPSEAATVPLNATISGTT